jgi:hypothetical protein
MALQMGCQADRICSPFGGEGKTQVLGGTVDLEAGKMEAKEGTLVKGGKPWKDAPNSNATADGEGDDNGGDDDPPPPPPPKKDEKAEDTEAASVAKKKLVDSIGTFMQMWQDR